MCIHFGIYEISAHRNDLLVKTCYVYAHGNKLVHSNRGR